MKKPKITPTEFLKDIEGILEIVKKIEDFTDHDWQTFQTHRKEYRDAVRDMFQVMRKMVVGI